MLSFTPPPDVDTTQLVRELFEKAHVAVSSVRTVLTKHGACLAEVATSQRHRVSHLRRAINDAALQAGSEHSIAVVGDDDTDEESQLTFATFTKWVAKVIDEKKTCLGVYQGAWTSTLPDAATGGGGVDDINLDSLNMDDDMDDDVAMDGDDPDATIAGLKAKLEEMTTLHAGEMSELTREIVKFFNQFDLACERIGTTFQATVAWMLSSTVEERQAHDAMMHAISMQTLRTAVDAQLAAGMSRRALAEQDAAIMRERHEVARHTAECIKTLKAGNNGTDPRVNVVCSDTVVNCVMQLLQPPDMPMFLTISNEAIQMGYPVFGTEPLKEMGRIMKKRMIALGVPLRPKHDQAIDGAYRPVCTYATEYRDVMRDVIRQVAAKTHN